VGGLRQKARNALAGYNRGMTHPNFNLKLPVYERGQGGGKEQSKARLGAINMRNRKGGTAINSNTEERGCDTCSAGDAIEPVRQSSRQWPGSVRERKKMVRTSAGPGRP